MFAHTPVRTLAARLFATGLFAALGASAVSAQGNSSKHSPPANTGRSGNGSSQANGGWQNGQSGGGRGNGHANGTSSTSQSGGGRGNGQSNGNWNNGQSGGGRGNGQGNGGWNNGQSGGGRGGGPGPGQNNSGSNTGTGGHNRPNVNVKIVIPSGMLPGGNPGGWSGGGGGRRPLFVVPPQTVIEEPPVVVSPPSVVVTPPTGGSEVINPVTTIPAVTTPAPSNALYVHEVTANGAAARAGLQPGDIILAVDGKRVKSFDDLAAQLQASNGQSKLVYYNAEDKSVETRPVKVVDAKIGIVVENTYVAIDE